MPSDLSQACVTLFLSSGIFWVFLRAFLNQALLVIRRTDRVGMRAAGQSWQWSLSLPNVTPTGSQVQVQVPAPPIGILSNIL